MNLRRFFISSKFLFRTSVPHESLQKDTIAFTILRNEGSESVNEGGELNTNRIVETKDVMTRLQWKLSVRQFLFGCETRIRI